MRFISPLFLIIALEVVGVGMLSMGLVPRELALFLLGAFIFFVTFAPLKQAALFAVFSIPLYTALPITESFDSMASWRIIILILFLRSLWWNSRILSFGSFSPALRRASRLRLFWSDLHLVYKVVGHHAKTASESAKRQYPRIPIVGLGALIGIFFVLGVVSLLVAPEPVFGIKKLLYFANIFALFFVIQEAVKNKKDFLDILKYAFAGSILTLAIGYGQFIAILFTPLYNFWQWWAETVIPIFYGQNLAELLSYSNTWFSYYENADPTLRIFSIFPDSHSFALFMILTLPLALTFFKLSGSDPRRGSDPSKLVFAAVVILILLAIIFSGTRGAWIGAVPVFAVTILLYLVRKEFFRENFPATTRVLEKIAPPYFIRGGVALPFRSPDLVAGRRRGGEVVKVCLFSFLIFAFLFPLSSPILKFSQGRHGGKVSEATLERISKSFNTTELSNKGRIEIWKSTISSIRSHPILGVGIGNYPVVLKENFSVTKKGASAHSLYLDIISEMGIFAGIFLLLIFFEILRKSIEIFTKSKDEIFIAFAGFFTISFLWTMAYSVVDVVLLNDKILLMFVTLVGLLYSISNIREENREMK